MSLRFATLRSRLGALLVVVLVLTSLTAFAAGAPITIDVGRESATVSFDAMFPGVTYVHVGDTVTFVNKAKITPHTVTFSGGGKLLAPTDPAVAIPSQPSGGVYSGKGLLNSGMMEPGTEYSVTLTEAGVFDYVCLLHPLMRGQLVVLPAGVAIPTVETQAQTGAAQHHDHTQQADAVTAAYTNQMPQGKVNTDGSVQWTVRAGTGLSAFSINQFFPKHLSVSEGDSVTFPNDSTYELHFVSFPTSPADAGKFFGEHGPNFAAMMTPMGGTAVDGTQLINSGGIFPQQSKSLTFPKSGTYSFICYLHGGSHMEGTITVQPKGFIHAYVNGKPMAVGQARAPHVHGSHVFVPVRAFFEQLGGTVAWDAASQTVSAVTSGTAVATAGQGAGLKLMVNGKQLQYTYEPAPHIHDGYAYVPAQELVNALGGRLAWDATTRTMTMEVR